MADVHALRRTSPKGGPFIGTCMKCGTENLPLSQMHKPCTNPANLTQDETLIVAINGERTMTDTQSQQPDEMLREGESLESQINRLAEFIMHEVPGEPSQNEGAVDTAIRWMRAALQPKEPEHGE